jgi:hypothetical protein
MAAAFLLALGILLHAYASPPREWRQIRIGDTPEQVSARWPAVIGDLQDIKGDFCYRRLPLGFWRLQVVYGPDHRVLKKHCILRLGTQSFFQDVHYEDTGT